MKKELGDLKNKVSKAEAAVKLIGKEYNEESKKIRELQARFQAANDIRQDAYIDLLGLKRQLHEKVCSQIAHFISFFQIIEVYFTNLEAV